MEYELPEGFEVVDNQSATLDNQYELPEGFEVVEEPVSAPTSTLSGVLNGEQQEPSPFASAQVEEVQPELNMIGDRNIEPSLSDSELVASSAQEVVSNYENIFSKYSTMAKNLTGYDRDTATEDIKVLRSGLVEELTSQGFTNPRYKDDNLYIDVDGVETEVEPSMLLDIGNSLFEMGGAIGGASTGARIGSVAGPLGALAGGLVGSAVGSAGGKYLDILTNKAEIIENVSNEVIKDQMLESGLFDIAAGVIGSTVFKTANSTYKGIKGLYDKVFDKNIDGAFEHAMKHFNIDEQQAKELVTKFEEVINPITGTDKEKAIKVLASTKPGGEALVDKSSMFDPAASAQVANSVFKRAEDLKAASKELSADNIQHIVKNNLDTYENEVKNFYKTVKSAGTEFTKDYKFDYDKLGLQPLIEDIGSKIENPSVKQRYLSLLTRVEDITESRSFEDLIDLRQLVNEIKYSTKTIKQTNKESLDKILGSIDNEIENIADINIPNSSVWKDNWSKAKSEYSQMKKLETNVLYKSLTRPGINEEQVVKSLSKYISAGDNTFYEVMEKLPIKVRSRVDGAIVDNMVEKYSAGQFGGNRAVHFPQLSRELGKISFKNSAPKVKRLVRDINKMSEIFKNDVNLARVSGNLEIPRFQSYLTTDPVIRMKYEFASSIFNYVKQLMPGDKADSLALLKNTAELLENPLSNKSIKDLNKNIPKDRRIARIKLDFTPDMNNLQNMYIERQNALTQLYGTDNIVPRLVWMKPTQPKVNVLPSGETLSATARGTVSESATKAIMKDRTDDLIAKFIQEQVINKGISERIGVKSAEGIYDKFVNKIDGYLSDKRLTNILLSTKNKLKVDDAFKNQQIIKNSIEAEAKLLVNRIEKDLGVKMPGEQADKLVRIKVKELMEKCNG